MLGPYRSIFKDLFIGSLVGALLPTRELTYIIFKCDVWLNLQLLDVTVPNIQPRLILNILFYKLTQLGNAVRTGSFHASHHPIIQRSIYVMAAIPHLTRDIIKCRANLIYWSLCGLAFDTCWYLHDFSTPKFITRMNTRAIGWQHERRTLFPGFPHSLLLP